jgi:NAD(P)-dependent dehydrogenase (short-subunit alcohol dehydrogenase family)
VINLTSRVAIVTGAGGGLGKAHAVALARRGARVLVNDLDPNSTEDVVAEIRNAGGSALGHACSVTDFPAVEAMVGRVKAEWGRIDILVNNAGALRDRSFAKMPLDDFRFVIDVHLMGSVNCTKAVWETMREQRYGRIVLTSSSSGLWGNFGQSNYGAAKMALVGFMQTLGLEGERYDIRVNALAPTAATQMTKGIFAEPDLRDLDPACVSPGVVFLASDHAPSRAILCAGAGSFECAYITVTRGEYIGSDEAAAERIAERFSKIADRRSDIVFENGSQQRVHELKTFSRQS